MARVRKKGLDYFPMNTQFIQNRVVRRLMKQEGDSALCILLAVYSYLYEGEGYYLQVDDLCFSDIAANFYGSDEQAVRRVVEAAVQGGLFDAELYTRLGVLTSAEIQEQFLFIKKRAKNVSIREDLRLVKPVNEDDKEASEEEKSTCEEGEKVENEVQNVTLKGQNVTLMPQSKEKQRKEKQSKEKENPLLNPPLAGEEAEERRRQSFSREAARVVLAADALAVAAEEPEPSADVPDKGAKPPRAATRSAPAKEWTMEEILRLTPPDDGVKRNYEGLLENLHNFGIPPGEQYAIIRKSNFGAIGHPVWKGFYQLRGSGGKIKFPGRFLLSLK